MQFSLRKTENIQDHVLTVVCILIAFLLMVFRHEGGMQTIRKASVAVVSYMEYPLSHIRVYRSALQTNEELGKQNILLQDQISRLRSAEEENRALRSLLQLENRMQNELLPVQIVAKNLTGINNSLTINRGTLHGVEPGMALINAQGLVGRVILSSSRYSQIMPFYNALFRASARIQGNRAYGIVTSNPELKGELVMAYIPETVAVPIGSVVETSGVSYHIPPYIPIGTVIRTETQEGQDTQMIFIRPFVSLTQIAEGFIVLHEVEHEVEEIIQEYEDLLQ